VIEDPRYQGNGGGLGLGQAQKKLMRRLCLGIVICLFIFTFHFYFFLYSHCFQFSVRGGSPIEKKKLTKVGRHDTRRCERNPFINITTLNNFGQYFLFDSEQQKWFIGGRDMGFWGFHLVGKRGQK